MPAKSRMDKCLKPTSARFGRIGAEAQTRVRAHRSGYKEIRLLYREAAYFVMA